MSRPKNWLNSLLNLFSPTSPEQGPPSPLPGEELNYTLPKVGWFGIEVPAHATWDLIVDFGTAATVVLAVTKQPLGLQWRYLLRTDGEEPNGLFSSDVLVDSEGSTVLEAGAGSRAAYNELIADSRSPKRYRLYSSLKRYIEERSRARDDETLTQLTQVMTNYLIKALTGNLKYIQESGIQLSANSILYASVPNGFDCRAVAVVRDGIKAAIEEFWKECGGMDLRDKLEVRIIREAVAVAQLRSPARARGLGAVLPQQGFPTGATPRWITVEDPRGTYEPSAESFPVALTDQSALQDQGMRDRDKRSLSGSDQLTANCRVLVLDVGAGTTDLTLVDLRDGVAAPGNTQIVTDPVSELLLNAGIPLGGDDVDRALLGALSRDPKDWDTVDSDPLFVSNKYTILPRVRTWKHSIAEKGGVEAVHGLTKNARLVFEEFRMEESLEDDSGEVKRSYTEKLERLVLWSVKRLLALIPSEFRDEGARIDEILLTGRASQLPEIRAATWEMARSLGINVVRTLDSPVQLKLAVALGCGLMTNNLSKLEELPSRRLGRLLRVTGGYGGGFEIPPSSPASIQHPLALRFWLSRGTHYVYEFRVSCNENEELSGEEIDELAGIGLVRTLFRYHVVGYEDRGEDVMMIWESTSGEYFFAPRNRPYTALPAGADNPKAYDPVSGLRVNFPSQKIEKQP